MNNFHEVIKARALAALHADNLPTNAWALKNRVAIAVLKVNTDLLTEYMAKPVNDLPRLTKTDHKNIKREIFKSLTEGNHADH